jgi:hypothetical protein
MPRNNRAMGGKLYIASGVSWKMLSAGMRKSCTDFVQFPITGATNF